MKIRLGTLAVSISIILLILQGSSSAAWYAPMLGNPIERVLSLISEEYKDNNPVKCVSHTKKYAPTKKTTKEADPGSILNSKAYDKFKKLLID